MEQENHFNIVFLSAKALLRGKEHLRTYYGISVWYAFQEDIEEKTTSLWTWLNVVAMSKPDKFKNMRYSKNQQQR